MWKEKKKKEKVEREKNYWLHLSTRAGKTRQQPKNLTKKTSEKATSFYPYIPSSVSLFFPTRTNKKKTVPRARPWVLVERGRDHVSNTCCVPDPNPNPNPNPRNEQEAYTPAGLFRKTFFFSAEKNNNRACISRVIYLQKHRRSFTAHKQHPPRSPRSIDLKDTESLARLFISLVGSTLTLLGTCHTNLAALLPVNHRTKITKAQEHQTMGEQTTGSL